MAANTLSQLKSTFVLIHGAWFGSFAWEKVIPLLEAKGYLVNALDLPGYGNDKRPSGTITLADYVKTVAHTANSLKEKIILVGHSMGSAVTAEVGEQPGPEKVDKLIFLDAFLFKNGESISEQPGKMNGASETIGNSSAQKPASDYLIFSEDGKSCLVTPNRMSEAFGHDCPPEYQTLLNANTTWQPVSALATRVNVTDRHYGAIPKIYIRCTEARYLDRTSILQNVHCEKIYTLPGSHSPFFSMPERLVEILEEIYKTPDVTVSQ